ncbi:aminotransferase class V-fold PLP-dependent enzyme [Histidinibacterium aquaticum]|uniref:Aminotransferase class V-fold PLP-dependent enzyme n=1 Tax=Histidinibacterium aquaticum TaxID=2613962 RepID=A0A5J5GME2_9RHOB|nr:aminotransferase class V-fold PLP-dependent enzyme [Histidinibacterium aquaticum]KAA9008788.1 aminotransferase class V-fold PLP-dependent enzyme [Histidinibacterium aquaticum]
MIQEKPELIEAIRSRFAHVDTCPFQGPRIFFENAGGALTLKSVGETSAYYATIPDNQGRANPAGQGLVDVIKKAKADLAEFTNSSSGQFIVGESGTELLFRMIRTACVNVPKGSKIIGTTIEHPASRSAAHRWAEVMELNYVSVPHDNEAGIVTAEAYAEKMTPEVSVATILHGSPVTGMGMDIAKIVKAIRKVSPDCFIIVDGIQHAAHGQIDLDAYDVDGYAISPYKVFSRHGYGVAWLSDRLSKLPHEQLMGAPETAWEFGTRDAGAYATMSDVVSYFDWLGGEVSDAPGRRGRIEAAGRAVHEYEMHLTTRAIHGTGNLPGLADMPHVEIIGGADNPAREGLVSFTVRGMTSPEVVETLNGQGIRTHSRKADHFSGNVLKPLGLEDCVRISMCHYNTEQEVAKLLAAVNEMA